MSNRKKLRIYPHAKNSTFKLLWLHVVNIYALRTSIYWPVLQVVVIFVICIVSVLFVYMLFLLCLDPLIARRPPTTAYQPQTNEEVNLVICIGSIWAYITQACLYNRCLVMWLFCILPLYDVLFPSLSVACKVVHFKFLSVIVVMYIYHIY